VRPAGGSEDVLASSCCKGCLPGVAVVFKRILLQALVWLLV
jgi:hypothetical protein